MMQRHRNVALVENEANVRAGLPNPGESKTLKSLDNVGTG